MTTAPDFKPGDIAIVISGSTGIEAHAVARLTKTRVVLDNDEWFPRDRLWRRQEYGYGNTRYLKRPDDPLVARTLERVNEDREDTLRRRVEHARLGVTLDDLRRVTARALANRDLHDSEEDLRAFDAMHRAFMPRPITLDGLIARVQRAQAAGHE